MKKIVFFLLVLAFVVGLSVQAQADLQNLGVDSAGNRLIYDNDLDITWYDYSNYFGPINSTWQNQMDWAADLVVTFGGIDYTDWRLPMCSEGADPSAYCTNNEIYHLYNTELGNIVYPGSGYGLDNTGEFQNLNEAYYWTGTEYINDLYAYSVNLGTAGNYTRDKGSYSFYAIAVRDGLAVAPEPVSSVLFLIGGTMLAGKRYLKRRRY